ncbi:MAG TPA: hypothetical protein VHV47_06125 [Opitutaceae bacterium]|nr:hypothetical protein [Opitutaceae bacterium]
MKTSLALFAAGLALASAFPLLAQPAAGGSYRVLQLEKVGGDGGWDYVYADANGRKLYIPRGNRVTVFDLDTLAPAGEIAGTNSVHGAVVDPKSGHGFCSSRPVVMWDAKTLATIKTIDVQGGPDGILFDAPTDHVFILSHRAPNLTVIDAASGTVAGTVDLGGAPEQGASDGQGRLYFDIEDKSQVAVVDAKSLQVLAKYDLSSKAQGPAGLALDAKRGVLFSYCRNPAACVILGAADGHIIASLPIGSGCDGAEFNADTGEAISSQGDGTLTFIKADTSGQYAVEQTVQTKAGARTSTLDAKTGRVLLITADMQPAPAEPAAASPAPAAGEQPPRPRRGRGRMVPGSFTIVVVGR